MITDNMTLVKNSGCISNFLLKHINAQDNYVDIDRGFESLSKEASGDRAFMEKLAVDVAAAVIFKIAADDAALSSNRGGAPQLRVNNQVKSNLLGNAPNKKPSALGQINAENPLGGDYNNPLNPGQKQVPL